MAKVIQVIETETVRGKGVEGNIFRRVMQYWTFDGELLAENDPCITDASTPANVQGAALLRELYPVREAE